MFLMIGIEDGRKDFEYGRMVICSACGRYGRMQVFMTFTALLLFFIPCFRWNKQYFVQMSCCGKIYRLDPEVGKRIAKGEDAEIRQEDLEPVSGWAGNSAGWNGAAGGWPGNGANGWGNNGGNGWPGNDANGWGNNNSNGWTGNDVNGRGNNGKGWAGNDMNSGNNHNAGTWKQCYHCGFETWEDFDYCPKCGKKFDK